MSGLREKIEVNDEFPRQTRTAGFVESKALRKRLADLVARELLDDLISVEALPESLRRSVWARSG